MKKVLAIVVAAFIFLAGAIACAKNQGVFMVFDITDFDNIKAYRTSDMIADSLDKRQNGMSADNSISTQGLTELHISGSAPLDRTGMEKLVHDTAGYKLFVVDLRQEAHAYLNSTPITWYADNDWINKGLSDKQAADSDKNRIAWLAAQDMVDVAVDKSKSRMLHVAVLTATDEESFVRSFQAGYKRFFVTDHMSPNDDTIDAFVKFCDELPKNAWLHFHCRGGHGRTTTFMALCDMLKNADTVSLADIISRQAELPPNYNILTADDLEADNGKKILYKERAEAVKKFYDFARLRLTAGYKKSWIEYLKETK